ncbi:MAG: leucine-rich repeat protein [Ruminococcus flavefaciens]|nr:leucine-rich repeat protein [Ruminococcus flavefaciens]MCM1228518.1 leucine-rich repeat protein [Ruminococcus flavefaciens]
MENVTLPDTIDYFGYSIFSNSTLVSVNIPKSLRFIPSHTFKNCKNLEKITFHDDILAVSSNAFTGTDTELPQNIQEMIAVDDDSLKGNSECSYNTKDDNFTFDISTDKETGRLYCSVDGYIGGDSAIVIPADFKGVPVTYIDFSADDTSAITSVIFPETDNEISVAENSFRDSAISEVAVNSPCVLKKSAFQNCTDLKSVVFKDNVTVEGRAFSGCTNITSVEFEGNVNLDYYAFLDCTAIENVTFNTLSEISGNAFNGCTSLMNINSEPVFDSTTGDFIPEYSGFIRANFYMAEEIGFLNEYTKAQYAKIAEEVTSPEMSDTEKVKALHDWVCGNTIYADSTVPAEYHTDASILLNDSTVCEGYAKAMNLLCNYAGIETYYVHSSDHAWNIVKIGGHYFHIDSTWDDSEGSYAWFLKSDSEMTDSHGIWNAYAPTSLHSFQKNGTPECRYQLGDVNTDGEISVADLVKMNRFLLNAETDTADNAVLYDLDYDGRTDVFDMILMRQKFTG